MPLSWDSLAQALRESCGVDAGHSLIVHSSMKAIGPVDGGPEAVVRALQLAVGEAGTLLMPTFSDPQADRRFDVRTTPSRTGLITETFRQLPGVKRSEHPTHSIAAWGRRRDEFLDGHAFTSGLGVGSPLHRAARAGAKVLMIGCPLTTCSVIHVAEAICRVPYLGRAWYPDYDLTLTLVDEAGVEHAMPPRDPPGDASQFTKVAALLESRGQLQHARLGDAACLCLRAADTISAAVTLLREDPTALLCERPRCAYCTAARRAMSGGGASRPVVTVKMRNPTPNPHLARR